jgi:hypothetical protein
MKRIAFAAVALFAAYVALSFVNNAGGYLGTDTGGKVATLRAMHVRGNVDPDVGYWAEKWDPHGRVHPLYYTSHIGHRWVNATTLPALLLAAPLYDALGYRGALAVPMLGAVACALAAAALARRLRPQSDGWLAFWVVGLASPVLIYALDFWEHTLGLALMAWAVVLLVDLAQAQRRLGWALAAGALLGAAATMRTEAFVYAFVATAATCLVLVRRQVAAALAVGVLTVVGFGVPLAANTLLERAVVGQSMRAGRAQGTVSIAGDVGFSDRVREALTTTVSSTGAGDAPSIFIGAGIVAAVAFAVARRDARGLYFAAALFAVRALDGLGFVPGFLVAAPVGAVGLALAWRRGPPDRLVAVIAVASLPLVWAFQFTGGAGPQWGGRYVLLSGLLLTVAGLAVLGDEPARTRRFVVGLAAVVTAFGLAWMSVRTGEVADSEHRLAQRPEPVLVSRVAHLVREGGGVLDIDRWLTAVTDADLQKAASVAQASGADRIAVVDEESHPRSEHVGAYIYDGRSTRLEYLPGIYLRVSAYRLG